MDTSLEDFSRTHISRLSSLKSDNLPSCYTNKRGHYRIACLEFEMLLSGRFFRALDPSKYKFGFWSTEYINLGTTCYKSYKGFS